jgi:hypothetical protein
LEKARATNLEVDAHNEKLRLGLVTGRERFRAFEPLRWDYGEMSILEDGRFRMAPKGRGEHVSTPVEITNHWGDKVQVFPIPGYWMERLDGFSPVVPVLIDGEMRDKVPFPLIDAQYGGEAPWIRDEATATPRM